MDRNRALEPTPKKKKNMTELEREEAAFLALKQENTARIKLLLYDRRHMGRGEETLANRIATVGRDSIIMKQEKALALRKEAMKEAESALRDLQPHSLPSNASL